MKITAEDIRKHKPCYDPTKWIAEDVEYEIVELLRRNEIPIEDRIWLGCKLLHKKAAISFGCWCVRNTPIGDSRYVWDLLIDERSRHAVTTAERYVLGEATDEELTAAARAAARVAAYASAAYAAAEAAVWTAEAAVVYASGSAADAAAAAGAAAQELHLNRLIEIYDEGDDEV